jgi:molybdopterin synthase sulfur carrier subunit
MLFGIVANKKEKLNPMATVFIPTLMQKLTSGHSRVDVQGCTVREIVDNLDLVYPGIKDRLVDRYKIKPNISVAIDGEVTPIGMLEKVGETSEVHFLPAIGGGAD